MKIRNLLLACIGIVGVIAVVGAGSRAVDGLLDMRRLEVAMDTARELKLSMVLSERISMERSKLGTLLGLPSLGQTAALDAVEQARLAVEDGLQDLLSLAQAGSISQPLTKAMSTLRLAHDKAVRLRDTSNTDDLMRADRGVVLAAAATQQVLSQLIEGHERTLNRLSPKQGQMVGIATLSQALREVAGFRSALLSPHLAQDQLSHSELRELDELSGQVQSAWRRIQVSVMQVSNPPAELLQAYTATSVTIMGEGDRQYRTIITALGEGRAPEMNIAQYRT